MAARKIVVVGNGMVGHHYVEQLLASGLELDITVLGAEPRPAYDRVHLSEFFAGRKPEELALTTREHYRAQGVKAHFGDAVTVIDRDAKRVVTAGGRRFAYDTLVLATGSYPFVPPIPGGARDSCLTYRTIDDLGAIRVQAQKSRIGVVIGGGLLGLECANALKNLGIEAHVVEFAPGLMGVQLDDGGSRMLRRKIEALGVCVHTGKATKEIVDGEDCRLRMNFADGSHLETDLIVFSAGIRPHDQIARDCGLEVAARGGIVVDYHCRTSDSDIFAIGECASFGNFIYGLVAPGYRMAEAAASQLGADKQVFQGADMSTKLKLLGVDVGSIGDSHGCAGGSLAYQFCDEKAALYKRINVSADGKRLLGAVLVGDCADYDTLLQYFLNGIELPALPESLILPAVAGGAPKLGPAALPFAATVCSCHNVSKGAVVEAIGAGCCTLGDVMSGRGAVVVASAVSVVARACARSSGAKPPWHSL